MRRKREQWNRQKVQMGWSGFFRASRGSRRIHTRVSWFCQWGLSAYSLVCSVVPVLF